MPSMRIVIKTVICRLLACGLTIAPKFHSYKLEAIVNLLPFLHFHQRLINTGLSLFTFKWQGKSL